jgi:hypothetical protein
MYLTMTLGAPLSESFTSLSTSRHDCCMYDVISMNAQR